MAYRMIRNNLKKLEPPNVPSISGEVVKKIIRERREEKKNIIPALIIIGVSILITILLRRKR